jgi:hypothetical protein
MVIEEGVEMEMEMEMKEDVSESFDVRVLIRIIGC